MKAWQITVFVMAFQLGLTLLTSFPIFNSYYPNMTYNMTSGEWETTDTNFMSDHLGDTQWSAYINESTSADSINEMNPTDFGVVDLLFVFFKLFDLMKGAFFGIFLILYTFQFPVLMCAVVQAVAYLPLMYAAAQWVAGRSGKSME